MATDGLVGLRGVLGDGGDGFDGDVGKGPRAFDYGTWGASAKVACLVVVMDCGANVGDVDDLSVNWEGGGGGERDEEREESEDENLRTHC